ncbi:hypothetical protein CVT26_011721 [Gymnopilus dilepis]|uniref:Retrotransposon gag domain-containing protein n=1 Tax=Gymnopilus dilepis TaxID=231916 RepID=A0A409YGV4_9AGAR|nr:hypothetical protein CVT26_011721 [Gymnopilus dilepis]
MALNYRNKLRSRDADGFVEKPVHSESASPSRTTSVDPAFRAPSPRSECDVRLYSDVTASRPPSPSQMQGAATYDRLATGIVRSVKDLPPHANSNKIRTNDSDPSDGSDVEDGPWTTVCRGHKHRARRSSEEKELAKLASTLFGKQGVLTKEQAAIVKKAVNSLTKEEREIISCRNEKISTLPSRWDSSASRGEGPSKPKGNIVDPRDWGSIELNSAEADIELQAAALKSFRDQKVDRIETSAKDRAKNISAPQVEPTNRQSRKIESPDSKSKSNRASLLRTVRPSAQINSKSSIGIALREASKVSKPKHKSLRKPVIETSSSESLTSASDSSSPSSEDSSSDSSFSSPSSTSSSSSSPSSHTHSSKHSKRTKKSNKSRKDKTSSSYKPAFKPVIYSGQPNLSDYHRFVREASTYIDMAKISKKYQIVTISHFLKDKAYDFYNLKVASSQKKWKLGRFFKEMFDYCFPVDYTAQMRTKLNKVRQCERTVHAFVFELEQLFGMFGDLSKRQKVLYLWYGLRREIQERMWLERLNPDVSSWKEVLDMAVIAEIALSIKSKNVRQGKIVSLNASDVPGKDSRVYQRPGHPQASDMDDYSSENSGSDSGSSSDKTQSRYSSENCSSDSSDSDKKSKYYSTRNHTSTRLRRENHTSQRATRIDVKSEPPDTGRLPDMTDASNVELTSHYIDFTSDSEQSGEVLHSDGQYLGAISFAEMHDSESDSEPLIVDSLPEFEDLQSIISSHCHDSARKADHYKSAKENEKFVPEHLGERMEGGEYRPNFESDSQQILPKPEPGCKADASMYDSMPLWAVQVIYAEYEQNGTWLVETAGSPISVLYSSVSPFSSPFTLPSSFILFFKPLPPPTSSSLCSFPVNANHSFITCPSPHHLTAHYQRFVDPPHPVVPQRLTMHHTSSPSFGYQALHHELDLIRRPNQANVSPITTWDINTIFVWLDDILFYDHQLCAWIMIDCRQGHGKRVKPQKGNRRLTTEGGFGDFKNFVN